MVRATVAVGGGQGRAEHGQRAWGAQGGAQGGAEGDDPGKVVHAPWMLQPCTLRRPAHVTACCVRGHQCPTAAMVWWL